MGVYVGGTQEYMFDETIKFKTQGEGSKQVEIDKQVNPKDYMIEILDKNQCNFYLFLLSNLSKRGMGGTKRLGVLPKRKVHTHTNILLNYNKQIHRGRYKNTHSHIHTPKQITQHQKKTFYSTTKSITIRQ